MGIVSQYGLSFYTIDEALSMGFFILYGLFSQNSQIFSDAPGGVHPFFWYFTIPCPSKNAHPVIGWAFVSCITVQNSQSC